MPVSTFYHFNRKLIYFQSDVPVHAIQFCVVPAASSVTLKLKDYCQGRRSLAVLTNSNSLLLKPTIEFSQEDFSSASSRF